MKALLRKILISRHTILSQQKETHAYNVGTAGADVSVDVLKLHDTRALKCKPSAGDMILGGIV